MAEYLTNTTDLTAIANAIRAKGGTTEPLVYPDGFVAAISSIKGSSVNIITGGFNADSLFVDRDNQTGYIDLSNAVTGKYFIFVAYINGSVYDPGDPDWDISDVCSSIICTYTGSDSDDGIDNIRILCQYFNGGYIDYPLNYDPITKKVSLVDMIFELANSLGLPYQIDSVSKAYSINWD